MLKKVLPSDIADNRECWWDHSGCLILFRDSDSRDALFQVAEPAEWGKEQNNEAGKEGLQLIPYFIARLRNSSKLWVSV